MTLLSLSLLPADVVLTYGGIFVAALAVCYVAWLADEYMAEDDE